MRSISHECAIGLNNSTLVGAPVKARRRRSAHGTISSAAVSRLPNLADSRPSGRRCQYQTVLEVQDVTLGKSRFWTCGTAGNRTWSPSERDLPRFPAVFLGPTRSVSALALLDVVVASGPREDFSTTSSSATQPLHSKNRRRHTPCAVCDFLPPAEMLAHSWLGAQSRIQ